MPALMSVIFTVVNTVKRLLVDVERLLPPLGVSTSGCKAHVFKLMSASKSNSKNHAS